MKAETLEKMVKLVAKADEDELFILMECIVQRRSAIRKQRAVLNQHTIEVGDLVHLVNVRPKYIQSIIFRVVAKPTSAAPRYFKVEQHERKDARATRRFGSVIKVTADCLSKVLEVT